MKTKKRKGQFISMIVVFTLLMISGGTLFSAVLAQNQITTTVNYSSNDVSQLMLAKTKVKLFEFNIRKETNYSFNIVAEDIGEDGGKVDWVENIPSEGEIKSEFEDELLNHEYGIKGQNRVKRCSPPVVSESVLKIKNENHLRLEFDDPSISCSATGTRAMVPVKEDYDIVNEQNNYLHMAKYARTLSQKVRDIAPDTVEGTGEDTSSCEDSDQSATREDAKDEAKDNAVSGHLDVASNAYSQTSSERESFISGNTDTSYEGDYTQIDYETEDCTYTDNCPPPDEEGSCDQIDSTEYTYEYRYTADTLLADFDLTDSEHEVLTENGQETIEFNFVFEHDIG